MTLRYTLSRLSRPAARRAFGRAWLGICVAGAVATLLAVGGRHLFFVATVWLVCVFAPVRIAVEWLHTIGPRLRDDLQRDLDRRTDRYSTREHILLMTETLFAREVRLPRLAPPDLGAKVVEAAAALCDRAFRRDGALGVLAAAAACAGLLERWVGVIATAERMPAPSPAPPAASPSDADGAAPPSLWDPRASVQEQWVTLRAVAGLAALTKTLAAVYEDSAGRAMEGGPALRAAADAAMDYADQVGLRLDGPAWEDVSGIPRGPLPQELIGRLAETWTTFCAAPQPSPRRLSAFVAAVPE